MYTSTKKHTKYWEDRQIDWEKDYFSTWNHPHRGIITFMLKGIDFFSLWEVGVGGGANLARILHDIKKPMQLGGSDVSRPAIEFCNQKFHGATFNVESADNMLMSDKSVDVILSDMTLIYADPTKINGFLKEFKRVGKKYVVLCEFHSDSWWQRLKARFDRYHVYDYKKLLQKHGYYDIMIQPIPKNAWPGTDKYTEFRSIITAKI